MLILSTKLVYLASFIHLLKRIFHVRRLLIAKSLRHASNMPMSYHKFTVRLAEHMMQIENFKNNMNN